MMCLKALLDPKILLEHLRACETKQFTNAIDLLEQCEERHRRNEKKLSRLTIAASAGGALVGQEAVKEVGEITGIIEQVVSGDVSAIGDAAEGLGFDPSQLGLQVGPNGEIVLPGGMMGAFGGAGGAGSGAGNGVGANPEKATPTTEDEEDASDEDEEKGKKEEEEEEGEEEEEEEESEEEEEEESEEEERTKKRMRKRTRKKRTKKKRKRRSRKKKRKKSRKRKRKRSNKNKKRNLSSSKIHLSLTHPHPTNLQVFQVSLTIHKKQIF